MIKTHYTGGRLGRWFVNNYTTRYDNGIREIDWGGVGMAVVSGATMAFIVATSVLVGHSYCSDIREANMRGKEYPAIYSRMATLYDSDKNGIFEADEQLRAWKNASDQKRPVSEEELKDYFPNPEKYAVYGFTDRLKFNDRVEKAISSLENKMR